MGQRSSPDRGTHLLRVDGSASFYQVTVGQGSRPTGSPWTYQRKACRHVFSESPGGPHQSDSRRRRFRPRHLVPIGVLVAATLPRRLGIAEVIPILRRVQGTELLVSLSTPGVPDRSVEVDDGSARAAHEVVVLFTAPRLVTGGRLERLTGGPSIEGTEPHARRPTVCSVQYGPPLANWASE